MQIINKTTKVRSLSRENILKKEGGSDCTVLNNKFSSVTLNELAMKARESVTLNELVMKARESMP